MRTLFAALLIFVSVGAGAQITTVIPPHPTDSSDVKLRVFTSCDATIVTGILRTGNAIRVNLETRGFCNATFSFADADLGKLPVGTYTYQIFFYDFPTPLFSGSFEVGLTPGAPALSPIALAILTMMLALTGFVAMRR